MVPTITRDELVQAIEAGTVTVVDTLPAAYYERQHLPGAVNLVEDDVAAGVATVLPDRTAPVVTYCSNPACPNSGRVANLLVRLGYTDVRRYEAGIEDWSGAGLPVVAGVTA